MKHFVLFYDYVPDILERRGPYRAGHIGLLREAAARGEVDLAGAFADGPQGMIIFRGEDEGVAKRFVDADPYMANGLALPVHDGSKPCVAGTSGPARTRPAALT